jgi:uncharacterized NAD(P)/FAD-binding protein YdhS
MTKKDSRNMAFSDQLQLLSPVYPEPSLRRTHDKARNSRFGVAIIGGGFTGATLAAQLLRRGDSTLSVIMIERATPPGRGVAYGTQYGWHLLNVPAINMSAFPDDPEHFLRWARDNYDYGVEPASFLPRRIYGQYIESVLRETTDLHPGQFEWRQDEVVHVVCTNGNNELFLHNGEVILADKMVLAVGNFPPSNPYLPGREFHGKRYVSFAWSARALQNISQDSNVLLIGSGLTSVDLAMALRAREFRGTIHIISRRGLLPQPHKATASWPPFWNESAPRTVLGLTRLVRAQVRIAAKQGVDWRAVIDSLRPFAQQIWRLLPLCEKRRFLRHLRPFWEVHRHRVAPEIASLIAHQLLRFELQIHAGRITKYREDADGVNVTYRDRETGRERRLRVARVINCTGPEADCRKLDDALLSSLRRQRLARPDPLFLGLDVSDDGALIDAHGEPSDFLYAVGPARKGRLWETTAVPEIRQQVAELAKHLVHNYVRRNSEVPRPFISSRAPLHEPLTPAEDNQTGRCSNPTT